MTKRLRAKMKDANKPWNLVIITADDLNADSMGWIGSKVGATPNIDVFAAGAHQFLNCHTVIPLCHPARAAIMTGLLPQHNGAISFGPVRPDVTTLTEVMNANGYLTAAINKTKHMMPSAKFDWSLALECSGKNPAALREHFEQCLSAATESEKPFFINANSTDPHGPFQTEPGPDRHGGLVAAPNKIFSESEIEVPPFLEDLPAVREEIARYFSAVRRFDQSVGEILTALKTANRVHDTVVVLISDHGMSMPYSKATLYRHATSTPVLVRCPEFVRPIVNNDMVSNIDLMPTLLDVLGLPKPGNLDGNSWLPLLRGEQLAGRGSVFTQLNAVKSGRRFPSRCFRTNARAYIWNAWADGKIPFKNAAMTKRSSWKAIVKGAEQNPKLKARVDHLIYRCPEELYDQTNDPAERRNLVGDSNYQGEMAEMKAALLEQMQRTDDPLAEEFGRYSKSSIGGQEQKRFRSP